MEIRREETNHGVRERVGTIVGSRGPVPLAIWDATSTPPSRLVLIGHGASGSKHQDYVVSLARSLVRHHGVTVVALDGPVHGERRADGGAGGTLAFLEFAQVWARDEGLTDAMVDDWRRALDAVLAVDFAGREVPVGYWGLSMGTIFGLPLVAGEPRIRAAVLGLMGVSGPTRERLARDAKLVHVPTMFLVQWDDELVARPEAFELFDHLTTRDKTLVAGVGAHGAVSAESFARSVTFLASRLGASIDGQ